MSLSAGSRLGPCEILGPLGAGGMGEVYRARDERLGRDVAITVLPEAVTAHTGYRAARSDALKESRLERAASRTRRVTNKAG